MSISWSFELHLLTVDVLGVLLFIDRSDNRVSFFINFFFVDLEYFGSLLIVQILASDNVSTSFMYYLYIVGSCS